MTDKEKIIIYNNFLISLHTARWTYNEKLMGELLDRAAAYSYARTNSNGWETDKELDEKYEYTLRRLDIYNDEK